MFVPRFDLVSKRSRYAGFALLALALLVSCADDGAPPQANGSGTSNGGAQVSSGGAASGGTSAGTHDTGGASATGGTAGSTSGAGALTGGGGAVTTAGTAGAIGIGGSASSTGAAGSGPTIVYPFEPKGPPFTTKSDLFEQGDADDLGLAKAAGTETVSIFEPNDQSDHFSNGVVLVAFNGYLYAQWQSSPKDEDSADTWTAYSRSQDGKQWSAPMVLAAKSSNQRASGGWWVAGNTLVAYINVYPTGLTPRGGYTEFTTSTDGMSWAPAKRLAMLDGSTLDGIFEQDPHALPDGRIIGAAHFSPGLMVAPAYTDDPSGTKGWVRAKLPSLPNGGQVTREIEPSWFLRRDGAMVMLFRDQESTYKKLASMSGDRGATWTKAVETDMPDSRAKQSAGNLPDGTAYQVSNPVNANRRSPLVVALSRDGFLFDKAFVLRSGGKELQPLRYAGKAKTLGYDYPKSMVHAGYLYVGYSVNKEDVEYTRVPLTSLAYSD